MISTSVWACTAPVAIINDNGKGAFEGYPIRFDGSDSTVTAQGATIVKYEWNFDDGQGWIEGGPIITHTFEGDWMYWVVLRVTDSNQNTSAFDTCVIIVGDPAADDTYYVDDVNGSDTYDGLYESYQSGINGPKKTIQSAIDTVPDENPSIIRVAPGTYENISISTENVFKAIYLTSSNPNAPTVVANTILQGADGIPVIDVYAEDDGSVITGFTITQGDDGGIKGNGSYSHVQKCIITGNEKEGPGAGIHGVNGLIENCEIKGNHGWSGGGLAACHGTIQNCLIADNTGTGAGAIANCDGEIINCTITGNVADPSTGYAISVSGLEIVNSIIWNNTPNDILLNDDDAHFVSYSCVEDLADNEVKPSSYWQLDETAECHDDYGSVDGTLTNGGSWDTGQVNDAVSLDGSDDYINLGDDDSLEPNLPMAISAWIKPSAIGNAMSILTLGGKADYYNGVWFNVKTDGTLTIAYGDGGGPDPQNRRSKTGSQTLVAGDWCHVVAIIRDATDMDLYVDGELDYNATYSGTGGTLVYDSISRIGANNSSTPANTFDGLIDEVAIYDVALSAAEIKRQYENGINNDDYLETGNMDDNPIFNNACDMVDITVSTSEANNVIVVADASSYDDEEDIVIEIGNDGVVHTVTSVASNTITFTPALAANCPEGTAVYKWPVGTTNVDENYHLQGDSPCINTGDLGEVTEGDKDIDGAIRVMHDFVDIGADEYGQIIYVDTNVTGGDDNGTSWSNAYVYLQNALANALAGDEIWVAQGTYYPDQGDGQTPDSRTSTFELGYDVSLYGGFYGNESSISDRPDVITTYPTILSGDIDVDSTLDSNNCYHVVTGARDSILDRFKITMGYAECYNSNLVNDPCGIGAGMFNYNEEEDFYPLTIKDCVFEDNFAIEGGGMFNYGFYPSIINSKFSTNFALRGGGIYNLLAIALLYECVFEDNVAIYNATVEGDNRFTGLGGGVSNLCSGIIASNCQFEENEANVNGGGMHDESTVYTYINQSEFTGNDAWGYKEGVGYSEGYGGGCCANLADTYCSVNAYLNCTFSGNTAMDTGGGMDNTQSSPIVHNCIFSGNTASGSGGGICNYDDSAPELFNCLLYNNTAVYGGGIANINGSLGDSAQKIYNCTISDNTASGYGGGLYLSSYGANDDATLITNSIIYGNSSTYDVVAVSSSSAETTYSLYGSIAKIAKDGSSSVTIGDGVEYDDPCFVSGDYHLTGDSVCVDAGDPNILGGDSFTDLDGISRIQGAEIDMGVYEYSGYDSPHIVLSESSLTFEVESSTTQSLSFQIRNKGTGTLSWTITNPSITGLTVSSLSGSVASYVDDPYDYDTVHVTVDGSTYTTPSSFSLSIACALADNSPQSIPVGVTITSPASTYIMVAHSGGDYTSIQAAINAASEGDIVVVKNYGPEDSYCESEINLGFKNIIVTSDEGYVIIDCQENGRAFHINGGQTRDTIIQGFRIENGDAYQYNDGWPEMSASGGGILVEGNSSPTIRYCVITGCIALDGGGIALNMSGENPGTPLISHCVIGGNTAYSDDPQYYHVANGGGLWVMNGGQIESCDIYGNLAYDAFSNESGWTGGARASQEIYHCAGAATYINNRVKGGLEINLPYGFDGPRVYRYSGSVYGSGNSSY